MFKKIKKNPGDALFVCKNCGEGFIVRNLERHLKEDHFWNKKFNYFHT